MKHETTINELAQLQGLFSIVDHITVNETDPNIGTTEEVTLPPPLIRRTQRRDDTVVWVLTPPGIHERIFVVDQAPVIVYLKDAGPGRFTGHIPSQTTPSSPPRPPGLSAKPPPNPRRPPPSTRPAAHARRPPAGPAATPRRALDHQAPHLNP